MKYFGLLLFPSLILIVFLSGCEYQLKDEYYRDVKHADTANIQVILDPQQSTYVLAGITRYSFNALTFGYKLYNIKVFVDSTEIQSYEENIGIFTLDCRKYTDGLHTLSVVVTTNSATGSIADLVGAEGFIYYGEWDLIVDNSAPAPVQITGIYDAGGLLKVEWQRYPRGNFSKYEILKTVKYSSGDSRTFSLAYISNQERNFFYDSSYLGGNAAYFVRVLTPMDLVATSTIVTHAEPELKFNIQWIGDNKVKIYWDRFKYYKAFKAMSVSIDFHSQDIGVDNLDTTEISGDFGIFGKEIAYHFMVVPQRNEKTGNFYFISKNSAGFPFPKYDHFLKNQVNNAVILQKGYKIYRYSIAPAQMLDSVTISDFSPDLILSPTDDVLLQESPLTKFNPSTLDKTLLPNLRVDSDNLSLSSYAMANAGGASVLYDFKNLKVIDTLNLYNYFYKYISEDNKYIFEQSAYNLKCYRIDSHALTLIWENPIRDFKLIPGSPGKVLLWNNNILETRDVASGQLISSFATNCYSFLDIDPASKLLMFIGNSYNLEFYNYETGLKVKSLLALEGKFAFKNGILYSGEGYYLPLTNIGK